MILRAIAPSVRLLSLSIALFCAPGPAWSQGWPPDQWLTDPVDDATYATFTDFFAYDPGLPFQTAAFGDTVIDGVRREHLSFQSTAGERVFAYLYSPLSGGSGRPFLLLLHGGNAGGKESVGGPLGQVLVRSGFNVLSIDMKYFGERKTSLLTTFTEADKHENLYNRPATYLSWVAQTVKDAGRSYDFLVEQRGVPRDRIGLIGFSRGAQTGAIVGGADDRFAAVALLYGGHFDRSEKEHRAGGCPANYIERISPRPLFLLNGRFDSDYDAERSARPLHELAREPVEIHWVDTGHTYPAQDALDTLTRWLREQLR